MPVGLRSLEKEASGYASGGFEFLKIKVGLLSLADDIERLRVIRGAVGPRIGLLVDANHAYNAASAVRMGRLMEEHRIEFFEEPVPPEDRDGYRKVRRENPMPVAGGECEFTRYGFRDLIGGGCVDIAQPDLTVAGGFSGWVDIFALAKAHGVATIPPAWGSGVAVAAALHAVATIPQFPHTANPLPLVNEPVIEFDRKHNPLRDELLEEPFSLTDGRIAVPDRPGLGIVVRDDILARYSR